MSDPNLLWDIRERMNTCYRSDYELLRRAHEEIEALRHESNAFRDRLSEMIAEKVALAQLKDWQIQPDEDAPGLYLQCVNAEQRDRIIGALGDKGGAD